MKTLLRLGVLAAICFVWMVVAAFLGLSDRQILIGTGLVGAYVVFWRFCDLRDEVTELRAKVDGRPPL